MRITGGTLKGRRVTCPPGIIRPAMDMIREALFSILADIADCSFLDLYSGSGIVGLEAVSRGARRVVCVERDKRKRSVLSDNLTLGEAVPGEATIRPVFSTVEAFLKRNRESFDIVFADPPFAYSYKRTILEAVERYRALTENGVIIIHHPGDDLPDRVGDLRRFDSRRYGGSHLAFYRCEVDS